MQPLQFTLSYFFPKTHIDFEFYLIAFIKKVDNNFRTGVSEKNNIGYIYFDNNLKILGMNDVVSLFLFEKTTAKIDLN